MNKTSHKIHKVPVLVEHSRIFLLQTIIQLKNAFFPPLNCNIVMPLALGAETRLGCGMLAGGEKENSATKM